MCAWLLVRIISGQKYYIPGALGLPVWIYDATKCSAYGGAQALNGGKYGC